MTTAPDGYSTVQPWLVSRDTGRLLDFIAEVFQGHEVGRVPTEDGGIGHAEIRVGDSMLLAFDAQPEWPDTPSMLRIWVVDANATVDRAVAAGARIVTALNDNAFGQRGARVRDPFGNIWWVTQHLEDVDADEIAVRMQDPRYVESMREAQATLDTELSGRANGWSSPPVLQ